MANITGGKAKKTLGGAGQGALAGAALGSVVPGVGTAIGAIGGGLLGGLGSFLGDDDEAAMEELRRNQELYGAINTPEFLDYNPEEYSSAGDYLPEEAQGSLISEDPALKGMQMGVLSKLSGLSETGLSDVDNAAFMRAQKLGNQVARGQSEAAMQNAAARGVGGSGMEFAMREAASQAGAERAQDAGLGQAAEAAKMRALYTQAFGDAASRTRGDDFRANAGNADILNRFTQMNTQARNDAQQWNLQNRQDISNKNVGERNSAQQYNNDIRQRNFNNQLAKVGGQAGANKDMAGGYAAKDAAAQSQFNNLAGMGMQYGMGMAKPNKAASAAEAGTTVGIGRPRKNLKINPTEIA